VELKELCDAASYSENISNVSFSSIVQVVKMVLVDHPTCPYSMPKTHGPPVKFQETQACIHHLKQWELEVQLSIQSKAKEEELEAVANVLEVLIKCLSTFVLNS